MALSGQLRDFNLLQLLALVQKTGKTGTLTLEHWGQTATICFQAGKLTRVRNHSTSLATALLQAGKIDQERFALLGADLSDKAIALLLSEDGVISREEVEEFARQQMTEELSAMFGWTDGTFKMDLNVTPAEGEILASIDLMPVLAKARARLVEFQKLVAAIPRLDAPLTLAPEVPTTTQIGLTPDEWRLIAAMSTAVPLRDLAQRLGMDELGIRKTVRRLMSAGLAHLPAPPAPPTPPGEKAPPAGETAPPAVEPRAEEEPGHPKGGLMGLFRRK